jgi:hypothetical protein
VSNRHQRRQLQHKLSKLEAQRAQAHARLVDAETRRDRTVAETLAEIEQYVDVLAQEVAVDEKRDLGAGPDDPRIYAVIATVGWRGVTTPEEAKEAVLDEVAYRSVNRTDLALLLSSIDHTAMVLWPNLPDSLRELHGEALVAAGIERLTLEDFPAELVKDARWAEMRGRWIRMGWRGAATEEAFTRAFIRAVVERIALIQDGQGDAIVQGGLSLMHDTIIDEQLQRQRPEMRAQMERAFKERLDREYGELQVRWSPRTDAQWRQAAAKVEALVEPVAKPTAGAVAYSDHALMRHGRELWETTYAEAMTDADVREVMKRAVAQAGAGLWSDDVSLFAAKWAVHAFQRLLTSHTFAAALMCSDVQREVLEGIEPQWDAFIVLVPTGMLLAGAVEFTRILVATYSFGAWLGLLAPDGGGFRLLAHDAPSLPELLASAETDLEQDFVSQRCLVVAKRLVAGLLLNLQEPTTHKVRTVAARAKGLRREGEPEHRIVTIGTPIAIDCRDAVKEYIEKGDAQLRENRPAPARRADRAVDGARALPDAGARSEARAPAKAVDSPVLARARGSTDPDAPEDAGRQARGSRVMAEIVKRCACGQEYSAEEWRDLPLVGTMDDGDGGLLELKNCACKSTMSQPVPKAVEAASRCGGDAG